MFKIDQLIKSINKEVFTKLYIDEMRPRLEIAQYFNISERAVDAYAKHYNIKRNYKDAIRAARQRKKQQTNDIVHQNVTKEALHQYYIVEDHGYYDAIAHFNIPEQRFISLLNEYGIKKDRHLAGKRGTETKYRIAGSKEAYNEMMSKKATQTKIKNFGSLEAYKKHVREAEENTNMLRYRQKWKATANNIDKYGIKYVELRHDRNKSIQYLTSLKEKPTIYQLSQNLNCTINCCVNWINDFNLSSYIKYVPSHYEDKIIDWLKEQKQDIKIIRHDRKILEGKEIDIYLPEYKLGIEFNGTYHHSLLFLPADYHQLKSKKAESKNIRIIHIYEYEWNDPDKQNTIKSIIKSALSLNIVCISDYKINLIQNTDCKEFETKYCLDGYRNCSKLYGLFYKDRLVQILGVSKSNSRYDWEIVRNCSTTDIKIQGGTRLLFEYFIKDCNPNSIMVYCDYDKFTGNTYVTECNMTFKNYTKPDIRWVLKDGTVKKHTTYDYEKLRNDSQYQITGCGQKTFVWMK